MKAGMIRMCGGNMERGCFGYIFADRESGDRGGKYLDVVSSALLYLKRLVQRELCEARAIQHIGSGGHGMMRRDASFQIFKKVHIVPPVMKGMGATAENKERLRLANLILYHTRALHARIRQEPTGTLLQICEHYLKTI